MPILEHLEELRQRLFKILWTLLPLFLFYVSFSIRTTEYQGILLPYPWPDFYDSVSTQVVRGLMDSLLPDFVTPVQLAPGEAIIVQFKVAFFLALLTGMPMVVYQISKFVAPGLYSQEKRIIAKITLPATVLFVMGVVFAYLWILPFTFDFLYGLGVSMGLTPLVGPDEFFDIVLLFFLGMGLAFQIPIIMWGLTALGVIQPTVWKKYWRIALVAFFFFGAMITPDGSGVTMMLVALPMTALYGAGYLLANRKWKQREEPPKESTEKGGLPVWSIVAVLLVAIVGGALYYNSDVFAAPIGISLISLGDGTLDLSVPAFLLYAPQAFQEGVTSGALLQITKDTQLSLQLSGRGPDDSAMTFELTWDGEGPMMAGEDGSTLIALPALWNVSDIQSLSIVTSDGQSVAYLLDLHLTYKLKLETRYQDGNRNGNLDPGEAVVAQTYLMSYTPVPSGSRVVDVQQAGIRPPGTGQLLQIEKGVFYATGPEWSLEASLHDTNTSKMSFSYTAWIDDETLQGYGLDLFLTRTSRWSEAEDHRVWIRGDGGADLLYSWSLDQRFGAIYPVVQNIG